MTGAAQAAVGCHGGPLPRRAAGSAGGGSAMPDASPKMKEVASPKMKAVAHKLFGMSPAMVGLVALCVVVEASKGLLANWENETKAALGLPRPWVPLLVFTKNLVSVATGLVLTLLRGGRSGLREALDPLRVLKYLPIAAAFAAAQVFAVTALKYFDAGSLKVFSQLSLPAVAILSSALLGRRYSGTQWQAILFLVLCSAAFIEVRILFETGAPSPLELALGVARSHSHGVVASDEELELSNALCPGGDLEGLWCVLMAILLGSTASVMAERFLKRDGRPYHVQKCTLMVGECLAAFCLMFATPHMGSPQPAPREDNFSFAGFDWRSYIVIAVWLVHGWVAGMVAKRLSAMAKGIAHILSATVSYVAAAFLWPRAPFFPRGIPASLAAAQVLLGVLIFATMPPVKEVEGAPRPRGWLQQACDWFLDLVAQSSRRWRVLGGAPFCLPVRIRCKAVAELLAARLAAMLVGPPGLLTAFIAFEATRPLLVSWAQQGVGSARAFVGGTFVFAQTLTSLAVAVALAASFERSLAKAVRLCTQPSAVLMRLPVACCFTMSKLALLSALAVLDAGTVRVIAQGGLPMVAVGGWLLGKRYSLLQWQAIWMIGLSVMTFFLVKTETERNTTLYAATGRPWPPLPALSSERQAAATEGAGVAALAWVHPAIFYVLVSLSSNCLGALLSEKILHSTARTPYYVQKAHLLGGECLVNFCVCLGSWLCSRGHGPPTLASFLEHLSAGWDHRTVITMLVWIPSGWCATLVVRRCSALSKNIAQSASSLLTYVFTMCPVTLVSPALEPQPGVVPVFLLALVCLQSVVLFVVASAEELEFRGRREQARRKMTPPELAAALGNSGGGAAAAGASAAALATGVASGGFRCREGPDSLAWTTNRRRAASGRVPVLGLCDGGDDACAGAEAQPLWGDQPLCQIDNAFAVISPRPTADGEPPAPGPDGSASPAIAPGGMGLARVSTVGAFLCDFAGEGGGRGGGGGGGGGGHAVPAWRDESLGEYPIGQTECNWATFPQHYRALK